MKASRRAALGGAAAALSVGRPGVAAQAAGGIGVLERLEGRAMVLRGSGWAGLATGVEMFAQDRLRTEAASRLLVRFTSGTSLTVGPQAEIVLARYALRESTGGLAALFSLVGGAIRLLVPSEQGPSALDIATRAAVASVRGTEFVVLEPPTGRTGVLALAGRVAVRGERAPAVSLEPGFGTDVDPGAAPTPVRRWPQARVDAALAQLRFSP